MVAVLLAGCAQALRQSADAALERCMNVAVEIVDLGFMTPKDGALYLESAAASISAGQEPACAAP